MSDDLPGKVFPRPGMAIGYIFIFLVLRGKFGRVSGDMGDSGFEISLFRFFAVSRKVASGLTHGEDGGLFSGIGLILGEFWPRISVQHELSRACAWLARVIHRTPGGLEKNS